MTKNLNWEILTKNLVTFKRWDRVGDDKFSYYAGSLKNMTFNAYYDTKILLRPTKIIL